MIYLFSGHDLSFFWTGSQIKTKKMKNRVKKADY